MGPSKRIRVTLIYQLRRKLSFKNVELLISANVAKRMRYWVGKHIQIWIVGFVSDFGESSFTKLVGVGKEL